VAASKKKPAAGKGAILARLAGDGYIKNANVAAAAAGCYGQRAWSEKKLKIKF